MTLIVLSVKIY